MNMKYVLTFTLGVFMGIYGPVTQKVLDIEERIIKVEKANKVVVREYEDVIDKYNKVFKSLKPVNKRIFEIYKKLDSIKINKVVKVEILEENP